MNEKDFLDYVRANQDYFMKMLEENSIHSMRNDAAERGIELTPQEVEDYVDLLAKALLVIKFS